MNYILFFKLPCVFSESNSQFKHYWFRVIKCFGLSVDKDDQDENDDGSGGGDSEEKASQSSNLAHTERSAVLNCVG